uniref:Zinc finger protein Noc n=1 Tax=Lygus hesperus TaxID=30085 RepID=A0A0A9VXX9_LYGHE
MVVLENSDIMTSPSGHQYLQPDYLSPLPTTLDAKKSPLALLAQTCSQIGADTPSSKPLLATLDKPKKTHERASVTPPKPNDLSVSSKNGLAFKPYEVNVLTKKSDTPRPASKPSSEPEEKRRTPSRKSVSPKEDRSPAPEKTAEKPVDSGASPIIRSGLEVLHGTHHKDLPLGFKTPLGPFGLPPGCCPPGLEANPAFRPSLAGHMMGYPGPYVSYARVKTPGGGEALVPVCKDPYCGGCQVGMQHALMGGACPAGCTQCEHQKYLASMMHHPLAYVGRPYVCNWIAGESYCGKRFTTSEELLTHLRSHTADTSLLNPLRYPNPPLSPLSAARYHPYGKPGTLPASLQSPFSAFNPTLAPYYSPYLYGQRIGAAVHP